MIECSHVKAVWIPLSNVKNQRIPLSSSFRLSWLVESNFFLMLMCVEARLIQLNMNAAWIVSPAVTHHFVTCLIWCVCCYHVHVTKCWHYSCTSGPSLFAAVPVLPPSTGGNAALEPGDNLLWPWHGQYKAQSVFIKGCPAILVFLLFPSYFWVLFCFMTNYATNI